LGYCASSEPTQEQQQPASSLRQHASAAAVRHGAEWTSNTSVQQRKVTAHGRPQWRRLTRAYGPTSHRRRLHLSSEQHPAYQAHQSNSATTSSNSIHRILFSFSVYQYPQTNDKRDRSAASFRRYFIISFSSFFADNTIRPQHIIDCIIHNVSTANERRAFGTSFFLHSTVFPNHAEYGLKEEQHRTGSRPGLGRRVRPLGDRRARLPLVLIPHEQTATRKEIQEQSRNFSNEGGYLWKGKWRILWIISNF